jgi:glycogen operon protein
MTDAAWNAEFVRCLGMLLAGDQIDETDERGNRIVGDTLLLLLNAHHEPIPFTLPKHTQGWWDLVLDTSKGTTDDFLHKVGQAYVLEERSLAVFRFCEQDEAVD